MNVITRLFKNLDHQIAEGAAHTLRRSKTAFNTISVNGMVVEHIFQFLHSVEDKPCVGNSSEPTLIFVVIVHGTKLTQ